MKPYNGGLYRSKTSTPSWIITKPFLGEEDEPTNLNAHTQALVIVFGVTSCQRHLLTTNKGILVKDKRHGFFVSDGCQRLMSTTLYDMPHYAILCYASDAGYAMLCYATLAMLW